MKRPHPTEERETLLHILRSEDPEPSAVEAAIDALMVASADSMRAMPRGRPPQDGTKRDRSIRVMCHSEQETTWRLAAESDGQDLSSWVRDVLDDAARKQLAGDRAGDRDR